MWPEDVLDFSKGRLLFPVPVEQYIFLQQFMEWLEELIQGPNESTHIKALPVKLFNYLQVVGVPFIFSG